METKCDPDRDMTASVEHGLEQPPRTSPASAVCYASTAEARGPAQTSAEPRGAIECMPAQGGEDSGHAAAAWKLEESDSTPRSEVPSLDLSSFDPQQAPTSTQEPGYFSPQPVRMYSTRLPAASNSANPSPTGSVNASTTSVHITEPPIREVPRLPSTPQEQPDRPSVHRDHSGASTASVTTVRAVSTEPVQRPQGFLTERDGPHYPNQSYAALQSQHYPPPYAPHVLRTRSSHSHPVHYPSQSVSHISTFGLEKELHHNIMDSGSRTVGNSPASSPGLFSPTTPPLRHTQQADEQGYYSTPYLHHTHRQAPKETHKADVDVDPISGRKIINQYEIIDELGRGVHGKVKLGRNLETEQFVAIKIVDRFSKRRRLGRNTSHEDKIKREIAILKKARHPNIVSLLEVIDDPAKKKVYIVLEHVELGEVRWRTEAAKEVALVEWRRYQRESEGIFDNENAALEDEQIITLAHQRLERQRRRQRKELHNRRVNAPGIESWSIEHGGDSDEEEASETGRSSRASISRPEERPSSRLQYSNRHDDESHMSTITSHQDTMETAYRSTTPTSRARQEGPKADPTGLEGTMYGAYEPELERGRAPSVTESSSSHFDDTEDEVPEHFRYVPLMTIQAARETFRDTVLGLEYLHYQGVIHRDIKPANLLQTKEHRVKISDFGVSYLGRQSSDEGAGDQSESDAQDADEAIELAKTVGTPAFYAPELCCTDVDDDDTPPVTGKIDVWALGVTLYCLIFGRVPFHDYNTFALMRTITDTEAYIPRFRLKAVAEKPDSRPNSHGRMYHSTTSNRRAPHDLEYEEVDDILHDLLKQLLIKDPKKRITIKEIKHHPWLLQGLENSITWADETDPGRSLQGQRIEVSKDDVDRAVVPITLIDRVRSGVRKTLDMVSRIGQRGGSRRRAQSTATNPENQPSISAHSSSSTISQEGRRPSLAVNQSIFEALRHSREPEHPLSQSVTASPEVGQRSQYFESPNSRTASPAQSVESSEHLAPLTGTTRPVLPERANSTMSSAASIRTVRQADLPRSGRAVSPGIPPALPGTPTALDTPGGSNLGGIFGGVPRRLVNSVRSREKLLKPSLSEHSRAKSIDRLVGTDDDAHAGPSVAISTTFAAGHVDPPAILKDMSPTGSQSSSYPESHFPDPHERASSRQSSVSSVSSRNNRSLHVYDGYELGPTRSHNIYPHSPSYPRDTADDKFSRAKDEFVRQRVLEEKQSRARASFSSQRSGPAVSQPDCPPSPDDEVFYERQRLDDMFNQQHPSSQPPYAETSPTGCPTSGMVSSSSEDQFTTMSQSTSNPSIPSVASANSSVAPDDCFMMNPVREAAHESSEDTISSHFEAALEESGYDGDDALESGEEDDESDEDFLVMTKKKSRTQGLTKSESVSNGQLARHDVRKEILSSRRRSTRSGSNGTVKKIKPHEDEAAATPSEEA